MIHQLTRRSLSSTIQTLNRTKIQNIPATNLQAIINRAETSTARQGSCKPRLLYYNGRGRGEFPRLVLAEAGVDYDDIRYEDIRYLKEDGILPFGQVPIYEEGSFRLAQSVCIARYIAEKHHLLGSTSEIRARAEMIIDGIRDVQFKFNMQRAFKEGSPERAQVKARFGQEILPEWLSFFEALLKEAGGKYYAGEFTYADISVFSSFTSLASEFPSAFIGQDTKLIQHHLQQIAARSRIAKWLKNRPETPW